MAYILYYNSSNGFETLGGLLILVILYLFFSNIFLIFEYIFKLISKILMTILGLILYAIAIFLIFLDYMIIIMFCATGWLLNGIFIKDSQIVQNITIFFWFLTLIIIRYYFKIKPLKFKCFQYISEKTIGLTREEIFSQNS
jgi:hypothetical protein